MTAVGQTSTIPAPHNITDNDPSGFSQTGSGSNSGAGSGNWQGENANPNARSRRYAWQRTTDEAYYGDSRDDQEREKRKEGGDGGGASVGGRSVSGRGSVSGRAAAGADQGDVPGMVVDDSESGEYEGDLADVEMEGEVEGEDTRKYCYCNRVSFGEMIACDGANCDLEWVSGRDSILPLDFFMSLTRIIYFL